MAGKRLQLRYEIPYDASPSKATAKARRRFWNVQADSWSRSVFGSIWTLVKLAIGTTWVTAIFGYTEHRACVEALHADIVKDQKISFEIADMEDGFISHLARAHQTGWDAPKEAEAALAALGPLVASGRTHYIFAEFKDKTLADLKFEHLAIVNRWSQADSITYWSKEMVSLSDMEDKLRKRYLLRPSDPSVDKDYIKQILELSGQAEFQARPAIMVPAPSGCGLRGIFNDRFRLVDAEDRNPDDRNLSR